MNPTGHLTRAERIQRIGELLSKGVALLLLREANENVTRQSESSPNGDHQAPAKTVAGRTSSAVSEDTAESTILNYLRRVGCASPRDIQSSLDLPKSTVYRHVNRLVRMKLVGRSGKTTSIRYRPTPLVSVRGGPSEPRFAEQPREACGK